MRTKMRKRVRWLVKRLNPADYENLNRLEIQDLGFGYDPFGLEIESSMAVFTLAHFIHTYYFRVESHGVDQLPAEGPVILTPNHSGVLPLDAVMIFADIIKRMEPPRLVRGIADHFFGFLPIINTALYRSGHVVGARRNVEELLKAGEMIALFPEGARGTGKLFRDRYRLRHFNVGFVELSLLHRAPIVPTAVIGGEEQYPMLFDVKPLARAVNFPYYPLTPTWPWLGPLGLVPFPTKYYIYYGEPLHFYRDYPPETVESPDTIRALAEKVKERVSEMIQEGLRRRKGVFGLLPDVRRLLSSRQA